MPGPSVKLTKLAKTFRVEDSTRAVAGRARGSTPRASSRSWRPRCRRDSLLHFRAEGADAQAAVDALITLVERDFPDDGA